MQTRSGHTLQESDPGAETFKQSIAERWNMFPAFFVSLVMIA